MTPTPGPSPGLGTAFALVGAVLLVWGTARAAMGKAPREGSEDSATQQAAARSFGWITLASLGYSVLGAGAALRVVEGGGLQAAMVQLLGVVLAAALGSLVLSAPTQERTSSSSLAAAGLAIAWLSLIGLPPAMGFHGKVLVYRALMAADWTWLVVLAMAGSAGALIPAFGTLAAYRPTRMVGWRAVLAALVLAAIVVLGLYPAPALDGVVRAMPHI